LNILFEPLRKAHDRSTFTCGEPDLDDWFRKVASQDQKRNVARVFVAVDRDASDAILGFHSLSSFSITLRDLPAELAHKLPRYDRIPAALIGRLARSERARGQGLGELLLADAIKRVLGLSDSLAVYALVVDAKNEWASAFYQSFGFLPFPDSPRRLFLLTTTARAAVGS
jgi:GNAT superfamily N-acetyltransferase